MTRISRLIVRLIAPWRTIRRLKRQVERLEDVLSNPLLTGIELGKERGMEAGFRGSGPQLLAGMFLGCLEDQGAKAPNYLEISFQSPKGPILVTVMQPGGATPHDLRRRAEAEARRLRAELSRLQSAQA
jgi:hypothetical protein